MLLTIGILITVIMITPVYGSFFEYATHRWIMHKPFFGLISDDENPGFFRKCLLYPFTAHAKTHHGTFGADDSYHLTNHDPQVFTEHKNTIPMAWWNWFILVPLASSPAVPLAWIFDRWYSIYVPVVVVCIAYYLVYEYIHYCMHLPAEDRKRLLERLPIVASIFRFLNGHHLLHHFRTSRNFNVVLPIADIVTWKILWSSTRAFPQPQGAMVPNVQPRVVPVSVRV